MLCSIELWLRFASYSIGVLFRGRWPLTVRDGEILARQLFSGHVRSNGRIKVNAFLATRSNGFAISLDRWSKAPERLFKTLGEKAAITRRPQSFKGFAVFDAARLKSIYIKDLQQIRALGAPTKRNPFHADIPLPPDQDGSFYLLVATELRDKTNLKPVLY